jgi:hypothetical protein
MFTVNTGKSTVKVARLEPGANFTSVLVVTPRVSGTMTVGRAECTYKYSVEGEPVEAKTLSSTPGRVEILARDVYDVEVADKTPVLAFSFVAAITLVVLPYYLFVTAATEAGGKFKSA